METNKTKYYHKPTGKYYTTNGASGLVSEHKDSPIPLWLVENSEDWILVLDNGIIDDKFFTVTSNGVDDEFDGNQVLRLKAGDIATLNIFRTEDRITVDIYSADDDDYIDSMSVTDNDLRLVSCDNCKHINRDDDLFCRSCVKYSQFEKYVD